MTESKKILFKEVLIHAQFGGFHVSDAAMARLRDLDPTYPYKSYWEIPRDDPLLIQVFREMGEAAVPNGKIVTVPVDAAWEIDEYDGWERVVELAGDVWE